MEWVGTLGVWISRLRSSSGFDFWLFPSALDDTKGQFCAILTIPVMQDNYIFKRVITTGKPVASTALIRGNYRHNP